MLRGLGRVLHVMLRSGGSKASGCPTLISLSFPGLEAMTSTEYRTGRADAQMKSLQIANHPLQNEFDTWGLLAKASFNAEGGLGVTRRNNKFPQH